MATIDSGMYTDLTNLKNGNGGTMKNDGSRLNAAAVKFIYDNAFKNLCLYEAYPIKDLTKDFADVAMSFKAYVDSGLPFEIVVPDTREMLEEKGSLPIVIRYIDFLNEKKQKHNVSIRVATQEFNSVMNELLEGTNLDFFFADDNTISRVSANGDKDCGAIYVATYEYQRAAEYFKNNFSNLIPF